MIRRTFAVASAVVAALSLGAVAPDAGAARPSASLATGFLDNLVSYDTNPLARSQFLDRMRDERATRIRIDLFWSRTAQRAPAAGEDPSAPTWAGYDWREADTAVQEAVARGLQPILTIRAAPEWAWRGRPPAGLQTEGWRVDPTALAAFASAAAAHFGGGIPGVPRVRLWQVWNEPNLALYVSPQWVNGKPASPAVYRAMLNAGYAAIKGVQPDSTVAAAGTSPFGDSSTSGQRMMPAKFLREELCLDDRGRPRSSCPDPAHFDAMDHHPYSTGGPTYSAINDDDITVPDVARKVIAPVERAVRRGYALPRRTKQFWVTEISWDSRPPDPRGIPAATQARWLQESLASLWRQGVGTITWFLIRDQEPVPSFATTYQSGTYLSDGTAKPSATAFRFPFVIRGGARPTYWLRAPAAGAIQLQRRTGAAWRTAIRVRAASAGRVITRSSTQLRRGTRWRAVASDGTTSLTWTVGR